LPGARLLEHTRLPRRCVLLFGQEGPGLSAPARAACDEVLFIAQFGSTRSINPGVASGIAMHEWIRRRAHFPDSLDGRPEGAERNQRGGSGELPAVWRSGTTARPDVLRLAAQHARAGTPRPR